MLNLWTAFGYFETQEEDERVLAEIARVLVPGGVFVLDTVNQAALLRGFRPQAWDELGDGTDPAPGAPLRPDHRALAGGLDIPARRSGRTELSFDHRLYTTPEYVELLRQAGLEATAFFGGADGAELTGTPGGRSSSPTSPAP